MKIKRLKTSNFRSIAASEIEFGDVMTVLAGPQGAGKSSHLHAVCACLTGRTPHTDRRGSGIKTQIRRDQARAEIELTCEFSSQPAVVKRTITETGQNLEVPFGGKNSTARQVLLTERMGGVDEIPDVLLDPRLFADRDEKEQTQALLKLLRPPTIEVPAAARAIGIQALASVQQVDDQIKSIKESSIRSLNAVIKNLEETIPPESTPEVLQFARTQEDAAIQHTALLQDLALRVQNAQFLVDDARKQEEEREAASLAAAELPALRSQHQALRADEDRSRELEISLERLRNELLVATQNRQKQELATEATAKLPGLRQAMTAKTSELQDCTFRYKAFTQDYEDTCKRAQAVAVKVDSLRVAVESIGSLDGACPTCSRKLTAKAKQDILATLQFEWEKEQADLRGYTESSEAIGKARADQAEKGQAARQEMERLRKEISRAEADVVKVEDGGVSVDEVQSKIHGAEEDLGALILQHHAEGNLSTWLRRQGDLLSSRLVEAERCERLLHSPKPDGEALEQALDTAIRTQFETQAQAEAVQAAAQAGRDTLRQHAEHQRIATELTLHRTQREKYTMALESLLKLKDSILGGEAARKLQDDCSCIFQKFFPSCRVILDPSGAAVAPSTGGPGTPVAHLSSGQKVVFDAALRIAAARATGFNLLAIDDANKLAPSAREALLKVLMESGCQVVMCTTADKIGGIPGAVVYRISNPGVWGPTKVERVV